MKEYLKISDVFSCNCYTPPLSFGEVYCDEIKIGKLEDRNIALAAVHAINSHDELVAEVGRLRGALERIYGDGVNFAGAEDLEDEEDSAAMQAKFNDALIFVSEILK